jgi:hypothetical protein
MLFNSERFFSSAEISPQNAPRTLAHKTTKSPLVLVSGPLACQARFAGGGLESPLVVRSHYENVSDLNSINEGQGMVRFLSDYVIGGELDNRNRNSVRGWIEFYTDEPESYEKRFIGNRIVFALTGNLQGEFEGRKFRFLVNDGDFRKLFSFDSRELSTEQIGAIGKVAYEKESDAVQSADSLHSDYESARESRSPSKHPNSQHDKSADDDDIEAKLIIPGSRFVMEWFGQNGHLSFEINEPIVEFEGAFDYLRDPRDDPKSDMDAYPNGSGVAAGSDMFDMQMDFVDEASDRSDDDNPDRVDDNSEESDDDDSYRLFSPELDEDVEQSLGLEYRPDDDSQTDEDEFGGGEFDEDEIDRNIRASQRRPWDEIIPGIDPQVKAMYEKWDEVLHGDKDEPLTWLFEAPLSLPKPDMIENEQQAWDMLNKLLAAMAVHGVAFAMCEHFTAKQAYKLLIEELLPQAHVHPDLVSTGFMQHYDSHEVCDECQAEYGDFQDDHGLDDDDSMDDERDPR